MLMCQRVNEVPLNPSIPIEEHVVSVMLIIEVKNYSR
jgi:hypothetical protein